jgi:hypothetical protein
MTDLLFNAMTSYVYAEKITDILKEANSELVSAGGNTGAIVTNLAGLLQKHPDLFLEFADLLRMAGDAQQHLAAAQEINSRATSILIEHGRGHIDAALSMAGVERKKGGPPHKKRGRPRGQQNTDTDTNEHPDPMATQEAESVKLHKHRKP